MPLDPVLLGALLFRLLGSQVVLLLCHGPNYYDPVYNHVCKMQCTKPSIYARQVCTLHVITLPTAVHT